MKTRNAKYYKRRENFSKKKKIYKRNKRKKKFNKLSMLFLKNGT